LTFDENYFNKRQYTHKEALVKGHVLAVLRWASKACNIDLLSGQGRKALDVGCAYGYTSSILSNLGYETIGIDISTWGIKQAKKQSQCSFLVNDAQNAFPFLNQTFDLVTCFDVLEHLPSPEKVLSAMFAVSKGAVVCTTPNKKVEKTIRKLTRDYDETHISVKSAADWCKCLKKFDDNSKVDAYFDCPVRFRGKVFFKSVHIPTYGLTVRIVIWKSR
jgi:2-polyprenyl-3-methyl-5-hydroxy-6-metoxy-1,4-benzoquinol methylase